MTTFTSDQIDKLAEMTGRHGAEKFRLAMRQGEEQRELLDSQANELTSLVKDLGLPVHGGLSTLQLPSTDMGLSGFPPPDAPPGVPTPLSGYNPPTFAARTPPGIPRPLKERK